MAFSLAVVPTTVMAETYSGTCGAHATWSLDTNTGVLTISGSGDMKNYDYYINSEPWWSNRSSIKTVNIGNGITSIGDYAFSQSKNLTSVTIGTGVTNIGLYAFGSCHSLRNVIIPDGVTSIGRDVFSYCSSLTNVTIPDSVTSIGYGAFDYCISLTDVYYGGSEEDWEKIEIDSDNEYLLNATIHYTEKLPEELTEKTDYNGETVVLPEGTIFDIGVNLNFLHGFINAEKGEIKAGDKKITGKNIYFDETGKIRLGDGETAKIVKENANGSTSQGFLIGKENAKGTYTLIFELSGTANGKDYTGRTITKTFNFDKVEAEGVINVAFTINNVPKGLTINIREQ